MVLKIEKYLEKYPEATLKDYIDYKNSEKKKEDERLLKIYKWHKDRVGKFFKMRISGIGRNDATIFIFKYNCCPPKEDFLRDRKIIDIDKVLYYHKNCIDLMENKSLHRYYFCCPYDVKSNEDDKLEEISEEDYDRLVKIFENNIGQIKTIINE